MNAHRPSQVWIARVADVRGCGIPTSPSAPWPGVAARRLRCSILPRGRWRSVCVHGNPPHELVSAGVSPAMGFRDGVYRAQLDLTDLVACGGSARAPSPCRRRRETTCCWKKAPSRRDRPRPATRFGGPLLESISRWFRPKVSAPWAQYPAQSAGGSCPRAVRWRRAARSARPRIRGSASCRRAVP